VKEPYGSFTQFQDKMLGGKVTADEADGYARHIAYERGERSLNMRWHGYTEEYATRTINGRDDPWPRYAQSPEFAVSDSGTVAVIDAKLLSVPGKTLWLLAGTTSHTWVAYQPNPDDAVPVVLECPAGRLTCDGLSFGKVSLSQKPDGAVMIDVDCASFDARLETRASRVDARVNGAACEITSSGLESWTIHGK
jgi:hypothetical protein